MSASFFAAHSTARGWESPRAGDLQCHSPSPRLLPEHDPPPTAWGGKCPQRSLCPNLDLSSAGRTAKLLDAVGVHGCPGASVPQIAAARAQRVRSLDSDITCVERE